MRQHSSCNKQVVQLWQRDRANLASFSINVQLYTLNHKVAFLRNPVGQRFNAKKLRSTVLSTECQFYS